MDTQIENIVTSNMRWEVYWEVCVQLCLSIELKVGWEGGVRRR